MIHCAIFSHASGMENVSEKLRDLRKSASPKMTVRAMAEALGMPLGTYSFYESATKFKKQLLPLDLTRRIAAVLSERGVDPVDVMKLAGLSEIEAEPESRALEFQPQQYHYYTTQVALPSEAALRDMFRSILVLVPKDATQDEAADILAKRLPAGFAAIGPLMPDTAAVPTSSRLGASPITFAEQQTSTSDTRQH